MFVVLVTGPPGSGKTATLTALLDALAESRVPHAGVDVDELAWSYPFPDLDQRCKHLQAWRNSHDGASLLVVAEVIESPAHLADLLTALGADEHMVVRLEADPDTLRARIIEREPSGWFGLEHLLGEMERLVGGPRPLGSDCLVFDTTQSSAPQIAAAIRAARPDLFVSAPLID